MSNIQIKDVPEPLHRQVRKLAEKEGRTIRDLVLEALERDLQRRSFSERLASRPATKLATRAAELLKEARDERMGDT